MSFEYKSTGKAFDLQILRRIISLISHRRKSIFIALFLTIATSIAGPMVPRLVQKTLDNEVALSDAEGLLKMCLAIFALMSVQFYLVYRQTFLLNWLGQEAILSLRTKIFQQIIKLKLSVYDKTAIGTMITRTVSDVEAVADVFSEGLISIIGDILQMTVILILMFSADWKLALIALSVLPVLIFAAYLFKESVKKAFNEVRTQVSAMNAFLQEHITGMSIVQAFNREDKEYQTFVGINVKHRDANIKSIFAYSVFFPVIEVISAISIALIIWEGGRRIENPIATVSFGTIVAFTLYINLLFRPIRLIADKFNSLQMGIVSSDRIFKVLDMDEFIPESGKLLSEIKGNIEIKNLWFAYQGDHWILKNINLNIQEGKTIAIVGHTGAGKSSIISLMNRLYPYQKGEIKIDGHLIEDYELNYLRKNISVVLQDVFLFSDTIFNNIVLFNPEISLEQVIYASKLVGAHQFISMLPGDYSFIVQERGNALSTGQRQLISFIRAIVQNPKILILDEATSSVDNETEELIQKAIEITLRGRTSIVIAHRLSTIRHADEIIVFDKGEIAERGNHANLLEQNGIYKKLYYLQFDKAKA